MNLIILVILSSFSLKSGLYFPLKESSASLNPGFEIELSKNFNIDLNKWGIIFGFKNMPFKQGSNANFRVLSSGPFFSFSVFKNFYCGFKLFYSLLSLQKKGWHEEGLAPGTGLFFKFLLGESPFFIQTDFDFIKGYKKDLWTFSFSIGI